MMKGQTEREAVVVRGLLDGGGRHEWRPTEAATIHVGSDPSCQWRIDAPGVGRFHWQLCWYGRRLWLAELTHKQGHEPRRPQWSMAPIGAGLRLGGTVIVLEASVTAERSQAYEWRGGPADNTVQVRVPAAGNAPSGDPDPDATQLVDAEALRAMPVFGTLSLHGFEARPALQGSGAPSAPSLEDMFIVPAAESAPPPRPPGRLSRMLSTTPVRALLILLATGGPAAVVFLPESLANRSHVAPARLPARRAPPEAEMEMRAIQPDPARADAEAAAAQNLATGRLEEALTAYRALQEASPENPVFRDFAAVIERRIKANARCKEDGCKEEAP
jgi:hypothetical protein